MELYIGSDHRGQELRDYIYDELKKEGYQILKTTIPTTPDDDYPDFAFDVCTSVTKNKANLGILICGNGIGISIAANKVRGVRAAVCSEPTTARLVSEEDAHHAKNHNGANVVAFGGLSKAEALKIVKKFIETPMPTEERHIRRIEKILKYEEGTYNGL